MKTVLSVSVPLAVALLAIGPSLAHSQSFTIDWYTIDGGGGTSTGGVYSVSGTIGQPDAGTLTGGPYTLRGGFWGALISIQVQDAPLLSIEPATGGALISWEPPTPGWFLQYNDNLSTTNWINAVSGETNPVMIPNALSVRFFRLRKP